MKCIDLKCNYRFNCSVGLMHNRRMSWFHLIVTLYIFAERYPLEKGASPTTLSNRFMWP